VLIRLFRGVIQPGAQDRLLRELHDDVLPGVEAHPDVAFAALALSSDGSPDEYLLETHWSSLQAMRGFIGDDWKTPRVEYEEGLLVSVSAHHYVTDRILSRLVPSNRSVQPVIRLDDVEIDGHRLQIQWSGSSLHLPPRAMAAMLTLASDPGAPVASAELARRIWPGSAMVSPYDVRRVIHQLRRLLRSSGTPLGISNLHGCGYSLELGGSCSILEPGQSDDTSERVSRLDPP